MGLLQSPTHIQEYVLVDLNLFSLNKYICVWSDYKIDVIKKIIILYVERVMNDQLYIYIYAGPAIKKN